MKTMLTRDDLDRREEKLSREQRRQLCDSSCYIWEDFGFCYGCDICTQYGEELRPDND